MRTLESEGAEGVPRWQRSEESVLVRATARISSAGLVEPLRHWEEGGSGDTWGSRWDRPRQYIERSRRGSNNALFPLLEASRLREAEEEEGVEEDEDSTSPGQASEPPSDTDLDRDRSRIFFCTAEDAVVFDISSVKEEGRRVDEALDLAELLKTIAAGGGPMFSENVLSSSSSSIGLFLVPLPLVTPLVTPLVNVPLPPRWLVASVSLAVPPCMKVPPPRPAKPLRSDPKPPAGLIVPPPLAVLVPLVDSRPVLVVVVRAVLVLVPHSVLQTDSRLDVRRKLPAWLRGPELPEWLGGNVPLLETL